METATPRTVIGLQVENFKRINAVHINPDPTNPLVEISGANAQGKSSVIEALWSALESSSAAKATRTTKPVRDGEKKATVRVDLGDIIVTRTWTDTGTTKLEVTSAETGAKYPSPQKLLDGLMGKLSFDPLAFTRMSSKEQVNTLLDLVDLDVDLDELAKEREAVFSQRTDVGREKKALGTIPSINEDLPAEETSASEIIGRLRAAQQQAAKNAEAIHNLEAYRQRVQDIEAEIKELQERLEAGNRYVAEVEQQVANLPTPESEDELNEQLATVEERNAAIRANNQARDAASRANDLDTQYQELTDQIAAIDTRKNDALSTAKFPLEGLSFDADGVTFQGVPLGQASSAEQIRVSCALAAAMNPNVRVMRVEDGSLLDRDSRKMLAELAAEQDFQVWMELVDETGTVGIVIEDGHVKNKENK